MRVDYYNREIYLRKAIKGEGFLLLLWHSRWEFLPKNNSEIIFGEL